VISIIFVINIIFLVVKFIHHQPIAKEEAMAKLGYEILLLTDVLISELKIQFQKAKPGEFLILEGLPFDVLELVCARMQGKYKDAKIVVVSNQPKESYEISVDKIEELHNLAEDSNIVLVLVPDELATSLENSSVISKFRKINIDLIPSKVIERVEGDIPSNFKKEYEVIRQFFNNIGVALSLKDHVTYLLAIRQDNWNKRSWGHNLYHLGLIPDNALLDIFGSIDQRLSKNYHSIRCLINENQTLINRIKSLEIGSLSVQKPLYDFLSSEKNIDNVKEWTKKIAFDPKYSHLNLKNWNLIGTQNEKPNKFAFKAVEIFTINRVR
jgi:hypothetical protein